MGESLVEAPNLENEMGGFQDSVSFGRFDHDSLDWGRWSTFPTNKYLEEVGKCSTPGSVAQKKAYFEAHYKKIATRKAELLDQESERKSESVNSEDQTLIDSVCNTSEEELDVEKSNTQSPVNGTELENKVVNSTGEVSDAHISDEENVMANFTSDLSENIDHELLNFGSDIMEENKDLPPQLDDVNEDLSPKIERPELDEPGEPFLVEEEPTTLLPQVKEEMPQDKIEEKEISLKETEDLVKLETPKKMHKTTLVSKKTNTTNSNKKPASLMAKRSSTAMPKSPLISTPKSSKPVVSKTVMSTTRISVKKENGLTSLTSKKATRLESKRVLPTSLHMSISWGPANSNQVALTTPRKSLIMERMGDKDIVKRAFKTFQNFSQLSPSSLVKPPSTNQFAYKKMEQRANASDTLQKKNEGITRAVKRPTPPIGQQGTGKASSSPGLRKTIAAEQRNGKSLLPSFGSRSQDLGKKHKEVSKKVEPKSKTKEAGKPHLQSKVKVEKTAEIQKIDRNINSKAKLSSSCNQEHGLFKGSGRKDDTKTEARLMRGLY